MAPRANNGQTSGTADPRPAELWPWSWGSQAESEVLERATRQIRLRESPADIDAADPVVRPETSQRKQIAA